jgi:phosphoglucosamine mutase
MAFSGKFGTDGIRGKANTDLSAAFAFRLGRATGSLLEPGQKVVIGRDTRLSGSMLGAAFAAGLCSCGNSVSTLGVCPTGGISYLTRTEDFVLGVVISASHNPAEDNGIKLLAHNGRKIDEQLEQAIELAMEKTGEVSLSGTQVGTIQAAPELIQKYEDFLCSIVSEGLEGMTICMDCAHGAAFEVAPKVFARLGATLVATGAEPNGVNINHECGATKPTTVMSMTQSNTGSVGIAFDGDADRAVFSDELGRLVNGDRTMAMWCAHWADGLDPKVVVGTGMSNSGFANYMESCGIQFFRADVGDKYVAAEMRDHSGKIGGEQSGHIIFSDHGPTGDGLVTALEIMRVLKVSGRPLSDFYGDFLYWPQMLANLNVTDKNKALNNSAIQDVLADLNSEIGDRGRIFIRPSGTQNVFRIMVEAESYELRDSVADRLIRTFEQEVGGKVASQVDLTCDLGD